MKKLFLSIVTLCAVTLVSAQDVVTLTVNGQGATKEVATANALRSAIEQAFGVFVSANTQILNDNLVKDEIATVSSGNIQAYKELSCVNMPNGEVSATLSATVAIGKLLAYAKSKGSSAEFAGQTFAMDMKMLELNKQNEKKALEHMLSQLEALVPHVFDWKLDVGQPVVSGNNYKLPMSVTAMSNEASDAFYKTLMGTLKSLSLSPEEIAKYKSRNMEVYPYVIASCHIGDCSIFDNATNFYLRDNYDRLLERIHTFVKLCSYSFVIKENGGDNRVHDFHYPNVYHTKITRILRSSPAEMNEHYKEMDKHYKMYALLRQSPVTNCYYSNGNTSDFKAIVGFDKYCLASYTRKKVTTVVPNDVLTYKIAILIPQDKMSSIMGFDVVKHQRDFAELLYYPFFQNYGDYYNLPYENKIVDKNGKIITELIIPNSVTTLEDKAFSDYKELTSVTIPETITTMGKQTFIGCINLKEVFCKAVVPPTVADNLMLVDEEYGQRYLGCKIFVPRASVEAYKTADGWSAYAEFIEPYDF